MTEPARSAVAARMAEAAATLLATLDPDQLRLAQWPFPSDEERRRWFYTPTDHGGLTLADMTAHQQQLTHRLLATGLSRAGYVTAATIMGIENVLDHLESFSVQWGWPRGRDPQRYFVRIFGDPGDAAGAWAWRFGGHHVSLHYTVIGGSAGRRHAVLLRRRSGQRAAPRAPRAAPPGRHRGRRLRTARVARPGAARPGGHLPRRPDRPRPRQPHDDHGGRPPAVARDVWRSRFEPGTDEMLGRMQASAEDALGYGPDHDAALEFTATPKGLAVADMTAAQRSRVRRPAGPVRAAAAGRDRRAGAGEAPP